MFPILSGIINLLAFIFGHEKNFFCFKYQFLIIKVKNLLIKEIFPIIPKIPSQAFITFKCWVGRTTIMGKVSEANSAVFAPTVVIARSHFFSTS